MLSSLLALMLAAEPPRAAPAPAAAQAQAPGPAQPKHRRPFVSPMGEPFRPGPEGPAGLELWFRQADANRDASLTLFEMRADAARFFKTLDTNHDGEIDPAELAHYENEIAPEIRLMGSGREGGPGEWRRGGRRGGGRHGPAPESAGAGDEGPERGRLDDDGLQGAGRYGLINIPEPVISADADLNRGVSAAEFGQAAGQRFLLLDSNHDGRLTLDELQLIEQANARVRRSGRDARRPIDTGAGQTSEDRGPRRH